MLRSRPVSVMVNDRAKMCDKVQELSNTKLRDHTQKTSVTFSRFLVLRGLRGFE